MDPTTVDMASHITPRHKVITLKATVLLLTGMTATTAAVHARPAKGNPGNTTPQDYQRKKEDALHANQPSISPVSHSESQLRRPSPLCILRLVCVIGC